MLLNSMVNTDYAAHVYAQYQQCCSCLCSILTMLQMKFWKTKFLLSLPKQILDPAPDPDLAPALDPYQLEKWDPDPYQNVLDPPHWFHPFLLTL